MIKVKRQRTLSKEERRLWAEVARSIRPLPGHQPLEPAALPVETQTPAATVAIPPARMPATPSKPALPPLAPMERKMLTGLRRRSSRADGVIDLHGMRQAEAHGALLGFLRRSQGKGHAVVLVITGKGAAAAEGDFFEERGVLRRVVPHWLRLAEVRSLVLGFEEAAPHHGGTGAIYVRLRRAGRERG